jgi:hypothetical protein
LTLSIIAEVGEKVKLFGKIIFEKILRKTIDKIAEVWYNGKFRSLATVSGRLIITQNPLFVKGFFTIYFIFRTDLSASSYAVAYSTT